MEIGQDKIVKKILSRLRKDSGDKDVIRIEGTWGSFGRLLVSHISEKTGRPVLYVCPHIDDADKALDDINTFLTFRYQGSEHRDTNHQSRDTARVELLSAWEGEEDLADATDEIRAERLRLVSHLDRGNFIIPSSIQAICQPVPDPKEIEERLTGFVTPDLF